MTYNIHAKFELNRMHRLTVGYTHVHTYMHASTVKTVKMNLGDFKTYKCVKPSKLNVFMILIHSLHSICLKVKMFIMHPIIYMYVKHMVMQLTNNQAFSFYFYCFIQV